MNSPIDGPRTGKSLPAFWARMLIISIGTIGRPHGLSPVRYQSLGSVMASSFWLSENGYSSPFGVSMSTETVTGSLLRWPTCCWS